MPCRPHIQPLSSRREFLARAGGGFGALAFSYLLGRDQSTARAANKALDPRNPLASRPQHFATKEAMHNNMNNS